MLVAFDWATAAWLMFLVQDACCVSIGTRPAVLSACSAGDISLQVFCWVDDAAQQRPAASFVLFV
jgi:hypothetical protein